MRCTLRPESMRLVKGRRRKPFPTAGTVQREAEHATGQIEQKVISRKESLKEDEVRKGQGLGKFSRQ